MIAQTKETLLKWIDHTRPQFLLVAFYRVQGVWGSFEKPQSPMSMHLWFGHMHGMITVISLHRALAADSEFMTLQLTGKKVPKVVIFVVNQKNTSQWKFTTGRCSSLKVTRLSRGSSWAQQSPQYFCLKHNSLLCLQYGQRTPAQQTHILQIIVSQSLFPHATKQSLQEHCPCYEHVQNNTHAIVTIVASSPATVKGL